MSKRQLPDKRAVEKLHDAIQTVSEVINEFQDHDDKAQLRDGLQKLLDTAIDADLAGGFGIYTSFGEG